MLAVGGMYCFLSMLLTSGAHYPTPQNRFRERQTCNPARSARAECITKHILNRNRYSNGLVSRNPISRDMTSPNGHTPIAARLWNHSYTLPSTKMTVGSPQPASRVGSVFVRLKPFVPRKRFLEGGRDLLAFIGRRAKGEHLL